MTLIYFSDLFFKNRNPETEPLCAKPRGFPNQHVVQGHFISLIAVSSDRLCITVFDKLPLQNLNMCNVYLLSQSAFCAFMSVCADRQNVNSLQVMNYCTIFFKFVNMLGTRSFFTIR